MELPVYVLNQKYDHVYFAAIQGLLHLKILEIAIPVQIIIKILNLNQFDIKIVDIIIKISIPIIKATILIIKAIILMNKIIILIAKITILIIKNIMVKHAVGIHILNKPFKVTLNKTDITLIHTLGMVK